MRMEWRSPQQVALRSQDKRRITGMLNLPGGHKTKKCGAGHTDYQDAERLAEAPGHPASMVIWE